MHFKTQLEPQLSKSLLFNYTYALFFSINTKQVTCDLAINTTFNFGSPRAGGLNAIMYHVLSITVEIINNTWLRNSPILESRATDYGINRSSL